MTHEIESTAYVVYVLRSTVDRRLYVGMTNDFERRFHEHNAGRVRSTKSRRPLNVIYTEYVRTRAEARDREKYLKSAAGRRFIKLGVDHSVAGFVLHTAKL